MSENLIRRMDASIKKTMTEVGRILENDFHIELNKKEKILEGYFSEGFLPEWYYYSNTPDTLAHHIYMLTQFLNANSEMLSQVSPDGSAITYFVNVGRDFPGRLARIIAQNSSMDIVSYNSESARAGMRIVTIEKRGAKPIPLSSEENVEIKELIEDIRCFSKEKNVKNEQQFLRSLQPKYLREELSDTGKPRRSFRHLELYEKAVIAKKPVIALSETENEKRISVALNSPYNRMITDILGYFKKKNINISRSYYDLFENGSASVGIMSVYISKTIDIKGIESKLAEILGQNHPPSAVLDEKERRVEKQMRKLAGCSSLDDIFKAIEELKSLANKNLEPGKEFNNLYLNSVTDFLEAAKISGLYGSPRALAMLLGFKSFEEFFVLCKKGNEQFNIPGYRIRHSDYRGPAKGGLRIDTIVNFTEVGALAFMMTWKCARSRILFGGAKGGLIINPMEFDSNSIDYFDTLSNFGRSLFLVTGPMKDVPAGDVGCGATEIGHMFEGFKSVLRDLALMVYGVKNNVSMIGDKIISLEEARRLLKDAFDINYDDKKILEQLGMDQEYLELVVAAQITGKPRMGLSARNGATGRGLCYATLCAVTNMYFDGTWETAAPLTQEEQNILGKIRLLTENFILRKTGLEIIQDKDWDILYRTIYPKMLRNKKIVVQGSGKVGGSILQELKHFGVNIIAVSDAGGAVIGDHLDVDDLLQAVERSRNDPDIMRRGSVINAEKNVERRIYGAKNGSALLELECDILYPAALENAVTEENAYNVQAKIEVCGSNGSNSPKAEKILYSRGVLVVYDFLANGGGVAASYFEWLRNLYQRYKYEDEIVYKKEFNACIMDQFIMPEFKERIHEILLKEESSAVTVEWNKVLRDIIFTAVNEDYQFAKENNVSMKDAGFINSQFRVLSAALSKIPEETRKTLMKELPQKAKQTLRKFIKHPETALYTRKVIE
jgi:glutamate dehydrogenase (NAD(P)+)